MNDYRHLAHRVWPLLLVVGLLAPMLLPGFAALGAAPPSCCSGPESSCAGMSPPMPCCQAQVPAGPVQRAGILPPAPAVDAPAPASCAIGPAVPVPESFALVGAPPAGGILQEPLFKLHAAFLR
jgi:hypothetical protein